MLNSGSNAICERYIPLIKRREKTLKLNGFYDNFVNTSNETLNEYWR